MELILFLKKYYPESISRRYDIETPEIMEELVDTVTVLDQIAIKRSCLLKGGESDLDRAALILLDDFRNVRLGNITLEFSQE
jgi:ribosome biogenesis GTPase A